MVKVRAIKDGWAHRTPVTDQDTGKVVTWKSAFVPAGTEFELRVPKRGPDKRFTGEWDENPAEISSWMERVEPYEAPEPVDPPKRRGRPPKSSYATAGAAASTSDNDEVDGDGADLT